MIEWKTGDSEGRLELSTDKRCVLVTVPRALPVAIPAEVFKVMASGLVRQGTLDEAKTQEALKRARGESGTKRQQAECASILTHACECCGALVGSPCRGIGTRRVLVQTHSLRRRAQSGRGR